MEDIFAAAALAVVTEERNALKAKLQEMGASQTVYVVVGTAGDYEDKTTWVAFASMSAEAAQEKAGALSELARSLSTKYWAEQRKMSSEMSDEKFVRICAAQNKLKDKMNKADENADGNLDAQYWVVGVPLI